MLLLVPQVESMSLLYSRSSPVVPFFFFFCCVLARTQCPNSLHSSGVSVSIGLLELGLVTINVGCFHPNMCLSLQSYVHNLVLVFAFSMQYDIPVTPACSAPFHECVRDARAPVFFVRPTLSPSARHLSHEQVFPSKLHMMLKCHFILLRDRVIVT